MCGRFTKLYTWRELLRLLNLTAATPPFEGISPSWNVAPSQSVPVVRTNEHGETVIETMRWGFTPAWALSIPPPINARSETVATSPMFREAFKSRRCLVPASGFYEWRPGPTARAPKQAFYIRLLNDPLLCFAGLWEPPHAQA
jgi:putative SOS response-associated peptidase YedK